MFYLEKMKRPKWNNLLKIGCHCPRAVMVMKLPSFRTKVIERNGWKSHDGNMWLQERFGGPCESPSVILTRMLGINRIDVQKQSRICTIGDGKARIVTCAALSCIVKIAWGRTGI